MVWSKRASSYITFSRESEKKEVLYRVHLVLRSHGRHFLGEILFTLSSLYYTAEIFYSFWQLEKTIKLKNCQTVGCLIVEKQKSPQFDEVLVHFKSCYKSMIGHFYSGLKLKNPMIRIRDIVFFLIWKRWEFQNKGSVKFLEEKLMKNRRKWIFALSRKSYLYPYQFSCNWVGSLKARWLTKFLIFWM